MPGSITHFSITQLPDANVITSLFNAGAISLNTLYPINQQHLLSFQRKAEFNNKALSTNFKWKAHDNVNNLIGNEAIGNLSWVGVSPNPESLNINQVINNLDIINLLSILPINDSVEFLDIISIEGLNNVKVNSNNIYVGQRLKVIDLYYSNFVALGEGGGNPYFKMTYKVGNSTQINATEYELQFNIVSAAELNISEGPSIITYVDDFDESGSTNSYTVKEESFVLEVSKGYALGTAEITININSAFLSLNAFNNVNINYGSEELEEFSNIIVNIVLDLDIYGKGTFDIKNYIVYKTADPVLGNINVQLTSINNDPGLVNGSQIVQLLTNL